jgi:hypothetical protein
MNNRVRRVALDITMTTVAGTGKGGFTGDGTAVSAGLFTPTGINFDYNGNLLIADRDNNRIRLMTPSGQLQTIAGDGLERLAGDGSLATTASLARPEGVVMDGAGNIFIADSRNDHIREILGAKATFDVTGGPLTFSPSSGGPVTSSQPLSIAGSIPGLAFTASASDPWISISSTSGSMPASISVSVDPAQLPAGTSTGHVTFVALLTAIPSVTVNVTANVSAALPPSLTISTSAVSLSIIRGPSGTTEATGHFSIRNTGGGTVQAVVRTPPVPWLETNALSAITVGPNAPVDVALTTISASLSSGATYVTQVVVDGGAAGAITLPVTCTVVSARPKILLSQTGMTFAAVAQGGAPASQSFGILNSGQGAMTWTAIGSTLAGGAWLSIDQTGGTVANPLSDVSTVNVSVNPAGLATGDYYGQIQVRAQGADNSPQIITVVLNILPVGMKLGPQLTPTALTFVGSVGSTPGSQAVTIGNSTGTALTFQSALTTDLPGSTWLQYAPVSATVSPASPSTYRSRRIIKNLSPGVQHGQPDVFVFRWVDSYGERSDRDFAQRK